MYSVVITIKYKKFNVTSLSNSLKIALLKNFFLKKKYNRLFDVFYQVTNISLLIVAGALGKHIPPPSPNTSNTAYECSDEKSFRKFVDPDGDLDHQ